MSAACSSPVVGYESLGGFNPLFQTYLNNFEQVRSFFSANPSSLAEIEHLAKDVLAVPRDRETLVRVLEQQNAQWGAPAAVFDALQDLRDPNTVAVVTGQQVGLFLGPLYTLHKAMSALRLAESLRARTGRKTVAVFWLHSEDHDFAEVDHAVFPSAERPQTVRYQPAVKGGPVGRMVIEADIVRVLNEVERMVHLLPFGTRLMRHLRNTWVQGRTFVDAFALSLRYVLPEAPLVFINPDHPALKTTLSPLFERSVTQRDALLEGLERDTGRLSNAGFTPLLRFNPISLFYMPDGRRDVISPHVDGLYRAGHATWTEAELLSEIRQHPDRFSPNVVTRPLAQDILLPTIAYVGGPGEIAYFAQLKSAYTWAGLPMPVLYPRASVTLVDSRSCKVMERSGLEVSQLRETDPERVFHRVFLGMKGNGKRDTERVRLEIHRLLGELGVHASTAFPSLLQSLAAAQVKIDRALDRFDGAWSRAEKRSHSDVRDGILHAWQWIYPDGILQERGLSVAALLARTGRESIPNLLRALSLAPWEGHQVLLW